MNALTYLIQVNLYLVLFYTLYYLILRNETFFKMNRLYLVGSVVLALAIPSLKAEWIKDLFVAEQIYQTTQKVSTNVSSVMTNTVIMEPPVEHIDYSLAVGSTKITILKNGGLNATEVFWIFYGCVTLVFLLSFFKRLYLVKRAFQHHAKHQAFSFFSKVTVDDEIEGKETILDHEMVHVKGWHSLDVIFFELFAAFNWFNPIAFAYKKAIKNIHEFIADETVASGLRDKSEYAVLLVSNAFNTQPHKLTNSFYNNSLLKRRLIMLNKSKSRKTAILKYGLSVPLFAIMVIVSSATIEKSETIESMTDKIAQSIPTVVQAITNDAIQIESSPTEVETVATPKDETMQSVENIQSEVPDSALIGIMDYFKKNIHSAPDDQRDRLQGMSYVTFELDENGAITNPSIIKTFSKGSYWELYRVLRYAKPFGAGLKGKYFLPIMFSLTAEMNTIKLPRHDFTKQTIDESKLSSYRKLGELHIRGYLGKDKIDEYERLHRVHQYFEKSIRYTKEESEAHASLGTNFVSFELDSLGVIKNPKFIKVLAPSYQAEIIRVINLAKPFGKGKEMHCVLPVIYEMGQTSEQDKTLSLTGTGLNNFTYLKAVNVVALPDLYDENGRIEGKVGHFVSQTTLPPQTFVRQTFDETKTEAGKMVDYIWVNYKGIDKPVILVDGKEDSYQATGMGFRLDKTLYPSRVDIKIHTGDEAVKNYNESARKRGLIVVTTK
ncbi:MAG: hypothetical protein EOO92_08935 [Pedobacter sp.]|nr:MAG: hypothetical protein EOO92_08935 [Pedobacter sp.]